MGLFPHIRNKVIYARHIRCSLYFGHLRAKG